MEREAASQGMDLILNRADVALYVSDMLIFHQRIHRDAINLVLQIIKLPISEASFYGETI